MIIIKLFSIKTENQNCPVSAKHSKILFKKGGVRNLTLEPDAVLTAAHCLFDYQNNRWFQSSDVFVVRGYFTSYRWWHSLEPYKCRTFRRHHLFDPGAKISPFDIALIQVDFHFDIQNVPTAIMEPCVQWQPVAQAGVFYQ